MSSTMIDRSLRIHRRPPGRSWQYAAAYRALVFLRCHACDAPIAPGEHCVRTGKIGGYECLKCDLAHVAPYDYREHRWLAGTERAGCPYCEHERMNWQQDRQGTIPCPACQGSGRQRIEEIG